MFNIYVQNIHVQHICKKHTCSTYMFKTYMFRTSRPCFEEHVIYFLHVEYLIKLRTIPSRGTRVHGTPAGSHGNHGDLSPRRTIRDVDVTSFYNVMPKRKRKRKRNAPCRRHKDRIRKYWERLSGRSHVMPDHVQFLPSRSLVW